MKNIKEPNWFKRIFTNWRADSIITTLKNEIIVLEKTIDDILDNQKYYLDKNSDIHSKEAKKNLKSRENELQAIIRNKDIEIERLKKKAIVNHNIYTALKERELKLEELHSDLKKDKVLVINHAQELIRYMSGVDDKVAHRLEQIKESDNEIKEDIENQIRKGD